ncbi:MAG: hypothetical protein ABFD82_20850 [Syntrophaceae bacterium]
MRLIAVLISMVILSPTLVFGEDKYTFDPAETEKKPYHFGGYVEAKPILFGLDKDSAMYKLKFYNRNEGKTIEEYDFKLQLEGSYETDIARLYVKTNTDYKHSYLGDDEKSDIYEGYLTIKPSQSLKMNAGRQTFKWGKGYAWNPVAFIDRPKDPDDPELAQEGFIAATVDYIKSFDGPLKTISFTPVLFPVYDHINNDFGQNNNLNFAGKLYFLIYDTDIDLIVFTGGSKTTRFGTDFSRNITTNLEFHGEYAYIRDYQKNVIDSNGKSYRNENDAQSYLLGIRYLTAIDTTYIFEYYHNGTGFTEDEMKNYYSFINKGYQYYITTGSDSLLQKAANLTETNYGRINPMRNYLYLRVSQKEPFDILYFTPAITGIWNVDTSSCSLSPEVVYTRFTNLELRLKAIFLIGGKDSEFGEKQNDYRLEFRAGYYF